MVSRLLGRGLISGVLAGIASLLFAELFGAGPITSAIGFEERSAGADEGQELVSRAVQSTLGLGVAVLLYGLALGGIFALVYAVAQGRVTGLGARGTSALVAFLAFVFAYLTPFVKYPASPPAANLSDTIGRRTALYLTLVLLSVIVGVASVVIARQLTPRWGRWNAVLAAAGVFVLVMAVIEIIMPAVNEVPDGFPADVFYQFRLAAVGTQLVLWTALGLIFGALTERSMRPGRSRRERDGVGVR